MSALADTVILITQLCVKKKKPRPVGDKTNKPGREATGEEEVTK
jgi:hypothetical protein